MYDEKLEEEDVATDHTPEEARVWLKNVNGGLFEESGRGGEH